MAQAAESANTSKDTLHDLHIGVLIKQVPIPKAMKTGADGLMDRSGKSMMNPHCAHALEEALALRDKTGGMITVFSMGPPNFTETQKEALRKGADRGFLLSDRKLAGSDTWATAEALATMIKWVQSQEGEKPLDVLFAGLQTIDGDTAHVGPQVAARLGYNQVTYVEHVDVADDHTLEVRRILESGHQTLHTPVPVMFAMTKTGNTPRGPSLTASMHALTKETTILDIETIGLPEESAGLPGSPTVVSRVKNVETVRGETKFYSEGPMEERVAQLLADVSEALKSLDKTDEANVDTEEEKKAAERLKKSMERDADMPYVDLREDARGIGVWCQTNGTHLADAALELLGEARRITSKLDEDSRKVIAVVIGSNSSAHTDTLIHHGADKVLVIEDERLLDYQTLPYTTALCQAIKKINPEIFLFSASTMGRDLAPRVAALMGVGLSADCTEFDVGYYSSRKKNQRFAKAFKMRRPSFGESKLATIIGPWAYPQSATARPGTFKPLKPDTSRKGEVEEFTPEFTEKDWSAKVIETVRKEDSIALEKADVIISGGMGLGGPKGFKQLEQVIEQLRENGQHIELGSSRAAVDAGFAPYSRQVGQTGKTVRPAVYIAVGISGAIQHIQGMKDSAKVIAINNDPNANIWKNADFGIVADYEEVLPVLLKKLQDGFHFPVEYL